MHRNNDLYEFLLDKKSKLTNDWYDSIDKSDATGVYGSADERVITKLKAQNYAFHDKLIEVFQIEEQAFFQSFEEWVQEIANDSAHLETPTHEVVSEFLRVEQQYFDLIHQFTGEHPEITMEQCHAWTRVLHRAFTHIIDRFVEEHDYLAERRLRSQQNVINELSAPIIQLQENVGLLPIVGDIDTHRAKYLLENTLTECGRRKIAHLYVDLSGVSAIDTMVALQIFQLIDALKLIGVKTTLSGVRPEIAMTSIQLGLEFKEIHITSNLAQAMSKQSNAI